MNSNSKPEPTSENSRRDFLQRIGAVAAVAPVVADVGTPTPANAALADAMPKCRFGKHMISRLVIGCNTLGNLSHLSRFIDLEMQKYNTQEQLLADFKRALELGINCVEAAGGPLVDKANQLGIGTMLWTARGGPKPDKENPKYPWRSAAEIAKRGPISIHQGGDIDILWRQGKMDKAREYLKTVRDTGLLVAITSHRPEVFDIVESQGWDVDYYMTCLYKYGRPRTEWEKLFTFDPKLAPVELYHSRESDSPYYGGETAFVRGDPEDMFKVIKATKKPCFVYKILASGRLCEKPEFVEEAFKRTFENIKPTDVVVVGHYTKHEDQYGINAGLVRKYGSSTGTQTSA
jgi:hypothetical protein